MAARPRGNSLPDAAVAAGNDGHLLFQAEQVIHDEPSISVAL